MLDYEYLLLKCVQIIKESEELNIIHSQLIDTMSVIHRNNVLEIFCLVLDELIIEKFSKDNNNIPLLLEEKFFKTAYGGNHFFIKLKDFITDRDHEMLRICYLGIKLGFRGQYKEIPSNIIEEIQNILDIKDTKLVQTINFKPKESQEKPYSFLYAILPLLIVIIVIILLNYILFKKLIPAIVKLTEVAK